MRHHLFDTAIHDQVDDGQPRHERLRANLRVLPEIRLYEGKGDTSVGKIGLLIE